MTLYVVHWRSQYTGKTGRGEKGLSKEVAQAIADDRNKRFPKMNYWIEVKK